MGSDSYNNNTNSFNNNTIIKHCHDPRDSGGSPAPRNATCATVGCEANVGGYSEYCSYRMSISVVGQLVHVRH